MQEYGRCGGRDGVSHYEMGPGFIHLRFRHGARVFAYTARRPGLAKVLMMQHLALEGEGLTSFVHAHCAGDYDCWFALPRMASHAQRVAGWR